MRMMNKAFQRCQLLQPKTHNLSNTISKILSKFKPNSQSIIFRPDTILLFHLDPFLNSFISELEHDWQRWIKTYKRFKGNVT